jgi:hypothetical protein
MHRRRASAKSAGRPQADLPAKTDVSRRHALIAIGKYAAYVTPAMTVLIRGDAALAGHQCGKVPNPDNPPHSCV